MTAKLTPLLAAIGLATPLLFASLGGPVAQDDGACLSGSETQQAIESGEIVQLHDAMANAGVEGEVIGRAKVCRSNGGLEYHVNVMNEYGESDTKVVSAQ